MNLKEKINMNIRDNTKTLELRGVEFDWKFSMASFYDLLNEFGYENERNLMNQLSIGNAITLLQVFYTGIIWENHKEKVEFRKFLIFCDYDDVLNTIKEFVEENIMDFLYPKKKLKE